MPIYEYSCNECGHYLTQLQRISEEPIKYCPSCKKLGLRRLVSAGSFQLKGTGWYVTDFKNPPQKRQNEKATDASPKKATDASPKKETGNDKSAER